MSSALKSFYHLAHLVCQFLAFLCYESSNLILFKELSSSIFQSLSVCESVSKESVTPDHIFNFSIYKGINALYWPRGYLLRAVRRLTLRWKLQILSYFYSFQSFQSIFGLYMMKQYVVKLRKLFPQFYTVFFVFDVTPW